MSVMVWKIDQFDRSFRIPVEQAAKEIAEAWDKDLDCEREYIYQLTEGDHIECNGFYYYKQWSVFGGDV
jgi:hypothetical protein